MNSHAQSGVLVTGGTGFIGWALRADWVAAGFTFATPELGLALAPIAARV